jgi:uncharacterized protein (DUF169 family)
MDYQKPFDCVMKRVMPQSFPIGIKLILQDDTFPEEVIRPEKYGIKVALCQWTNLARRWGWVVGARADDISCTPCLAGFGFRKLQNKADLAGFFVEMGYFESPDLAMSITEQIKLIEPGKVKGIVAFPLNKAPVEPDVVVIYGTPAQMIRLTYGYIHAYGRLIRSETGFGLSCLSAVSPFQTEEPIFVHPGRGERILAGTDDCEMFFTLPASRLAAVVDGLEKTQAKGLRYPIQGYVLYEPPAIPAMEALEKKLTAPGLD